MKKLFTGLFSILVVSSFSIGATHAATTFVCPAADKVMCIPSVTVISTPTGDWKANGGMMTGNTFVNNNQCANVIPLPGSQNRLLCCYSKCGVFVMDVPYSHCVKNTQARFTCK